MVQARSVKQLVPAVPTSDGAGVKLNRTIGTPQLDHLDPFLLLDAFHTEDAADYIAGFPDHPHRGFETVTYMIEGRMRHRDNQGNSGLLRSGGAQWMTAGRGIVHSEMPEQEDGLMSGFQLWVNLPADRKMCPPRYQDIDPEDVPEMTRADSVRVRVVAGEAAGLKGAATGIAVDPLYIDVSLPPGTSFTQPVARGHTGFAYVFQGKVRIGDTDVGNQVLAELTDGEAVTVTAPGDPARLLLIAGRPLGEPIARYGPFVMNTREELAQAFEDFQRGTF